VQATHNIASSGGALINWLLANQDLALLLATFGGMLVLLMAEQIWPRRTSNDSQAMRWINNWLLAAVNFFALFFLLLALSGMPWLQALTPQNSVFASLPAAVTLVALMIGIEAVQYTLHRLFHAVPLLWRLHAVHHSDPWVDVTSSHRHHLIEVLITSSLLLPLILMAGVPVVLLIIAMFIRLAIVLLSHSNLKLPRRLDSLLRPFVVTPDFHRVHHSSEQRLTDSNFGTVLPLFDYLFGTAQNISWQEQASMRCGLDAWREPRDSRLDRLLLMPLLWRAGNPMHAAGGDAAVMPVAPNTDTTIVADPQP
tara:strand:+ start:4414 stop:5343 length:930 start_codon:yes stop_codon:yes gene_type:complete